MKPSVIFRPWKPTICADCGQPNPTLSRDGMRGPWRCGRCDRMAGGLL